MRKPSAGAMRAARAINERLATPYTDATVLAEVIDRETEAPKLRAMLEIVTAALENVLLHQEARPGEPMTKDDRAGRLRLIREAREAIEQL